MHLRLCKSEKWQHYTKVIGKYLRQADAGTHRTSTPGCCFPPHPSLRRSGPVGQSGARTACLPPRDRPTRSRPGVPRLLPGHRALRCLVLMHGSPLTGTNPIPDGMQAALKGAQTGMLVTRTPRGQTVAGCQQDHPAPGSSQAQHSGMTATAQLCLRAGLMASYEVLVGSPSGAGGKPLRCWLEAPQVLVGSPSGAGGKPLSHRLDAVCLLCGQKRPPWNEA
ncbi:unnamed protein product [Gadus morhua 'NCC']